MAFPSAVPSEGEPAQSDGDRAQEASQRSTDRGGERNVDWTRRGVTAMPHRVYVVGTGASTAIGLSAPATAAAVRAGIAGMVRHPFLIDKMAAPMLICANPVLPI